MQFVKRMKFQLALIAGLSVLVAFLNNCSSGYEAIQIEQSSESSNGTPTPTPTPTMTVSPSPTPTVTVSPTPTATPTATPPAGAVAITGLTGTPSYGQPLVISGNNFGAVGPVVQVFDTFESGNNSARIMTTSPQVGQWSLADTGPTYSTSFAVSGTKSMRVNFANGVLIDNNQLQKTWAEDTGFYLSFWQLLPQGKDIPGTNHPDSPNLKQFWLGNASNGFPWLADYVDVILANNFGSALWIKADDTNNGALQDCSYHQTLSTRGTWTRLTYFMRAGSSANGEWWSQEVNGSRQINPCAANNRTTSRNNRGWNKVALPGYGRNDANSELYYDDVYVATGSGARARVELGNAQTYSQSTSLAVMSPLSWSNTSVSVMFRASQFQSGSTVWLYVTDAAGNVNANGFPIVLP